ncbi:sulfatase [Mediterranea massiliensis]|uniref:sulfatase family protein n=1 Tax=Mediterranea massiliensis TaxID=1841865 RepID=UPI0032090679
MKADYLKISFLVVGSIPSLNVMFAQNTPNILLIVSEDNGCDLGCYGNTKVFTPNIDSLASNGMRFMNAYVTYSVSSPSRSSIFTGLYPHQNGQIGLATHKYRMYEGVKTLPQYLRELGYFSACIGKKHVNPEADISFDYWDNRSSNFEKKNLKSYAEKTVSFCKSLHGNPFFVMVNFPDAHFPLQREVEGLPHHLVDKSQVAPLPYINVNSSRHKYFVESYYDCINRLDESIGFLLQEMSKNKLLDNTIIIYMSDHGEQFPRAKCSNYEAGLHIPFIISWPNHVKEGITNNALISTIDLLPTFIELAGGKIPANLPGKSLLPILKGKSENLHSYIFAGGMGSAPIMHYPRRSVRDSRYKLIVNYNYMEDNPHYQLYVNQEGHFAGGLSMEELEMAPDSMKHVFQTWKRPPLYELYDLWVDPYEFHNLSDKEKYKSVLENLKTVLSEWQEITNDPIRDPNKLRAINEEVKAILRNEIDYTQPDFKWGYLDYFIDKK